MTDETVMHTPGPWSNERIWDTPASRIHARVDGIPVALAEVFTMRGVGEKEANARLIAAAPDLLALCKSMEDWLRPEVVKEPDRSYFWKLVAVIKKAEGRL
jgi:hypothetical protein